jgi:multidrug transporter EmrE-like cation transporter
MRYIPFILFTVLTNAAAQLMLKQGMTHLVPVSIGALSFTPETIVGKVGMALLNPWVIAGLTTFVISMASHMFVLSKVELSFAYPFLSLAYVAVAVAAWTLFGEDLNALRVAGIGLICVGTILIAQGGEGASHSATSAAHRAHPPLIAKLSE